MPPVFATVSGKGLAVLNSDYESTSVSLLDPTTRTLVHDDCVNSGSASPQLSLALSGDVVLPSQPQANNDLVLIDRGNNAITWVDPQSCAIRQQLSVATGFNSNPHDIIAISDEKAYVTRYAKNGAASQDPNGVGDDLLIINPKAKTILGRIDLSDRAAPVDGAVIQARPDNGILAGGKVYVSLGSTSADYAAAGAGRIAIVDPADDRVLGTIDVPGLKSCSRLDYQESSKTLLVACGGSFADADQIGESGVALIDVGVEPPAVKKIISGTTIGAGEVNFAWVLSLGDDRLLAGTLGALDFTTNAQTAPDTLQSIDPATGAATKLLEGGAFNFGRAGGGGAARIVFLPDGSAKAPIVHVIDASVTPAAPLADVDANPSQKLPPREIAWY